MEGNNGLHKLIIKNDEMMLDDFKIKGLIRYELKKNSANLPAELLIVLQVKDLTLNL
jgi:hypothetical protein